MKLTSSVLTFLDRFLQGFLLRHAADMPTPFAKGIAWYWPYAPIRKVYLDRLGVYMGEGSVANVGLIPITGGNSRALIGRNVSIAPNVTLVLSSAPNNGVELNGFAYVKERLTDHKAIVIRDEAWIGTNVTILPGVTVGRCAVIGAGCILTRNADDYGIYAGVPGRKVGDVRQLEDGFVKQDEVRSVL